MVLKTPDEITRAHVDGRKPVLSRVFNEHLPSQRADEDVITTEKEEFMSNLRARNVRNSTRVAEPPKQRRRRLDKNTSVVS